MHVLILHQNISLSSLTVKKHHCGAVERVCLQELVVILGTANHGRERLQIVKRLLDR